MIPTSPLNLGTPHPELASQHARESAEAVRKEIISKIVGAMIEQRHTLNLTQRDLAELCGLPHSSVARIESGKSSPNLTTLLKIFGQLGLQLTVQPTAFK